MGLTNDLLGLVNSLGQSISNHGSQQPNIEVPKINLNTLHSCQLKIARSSLSEAAYYLWNEREKRGYYVEQKRTNC